MATSKTQNLIDQAKSFLANFGNNVQKTVDAGQRAIIGLQNRLESPKGFSPFPTIKQSPQDSGIVSLGKTIANVPSEVGNVIVGQGVVNPAVDIGRFIGKTITGQPLPKYNELKPGAVKLGAGVAYKRPLTDILADAAATLTPILYSYGGGKIKAGGEAGAAGKIALKKLVTKGAIGGAKTGAELGFLSGVEEGRGKTVPEQLSEGAKSAVQSGAFGAALGGVTPVVGRVGRNLVDLYQGSKVSPNLQKGSTTLFGQDPLASKDPWAGQPDVMGKNMVSSASLSQKQIEDALNRWDFNEAQKLISQLPPSDPYRESMQTLLNNLSNNPPPGFQKGSTSLFNFGKKKPAKGTTTPQVSEQTPVLNPSQPSIPERGITQPKGVGVVPEGKLRGFPETVSTTLGTPEKIAKGVLTEPSNYYDPLTNKEVMAKAQEVISQSEGKALHLAKTGTDTQANGTAMALIDKYLKSGENEKALSLIKDVAPRFTAQGQQIQILSQYGKLTPSGALKFLQQTVDQANKHLPKNGQIKITDKIVKEVSALAEKASSLPDGREKVVVAAQMLDKIAEQVPVPIGKKVALIQTFSQLINPKTAIRNVLGNSLFSVVENVSDTVGAGIDKTVGLFTGKRSLVTPSIKSQIAGFKKGFKLGLEDTIKGINTGATGTQFDLPQTRIFRKGILGKIEKVLNFELRVPDRAAYNAAFEGSINNQMRAAGVKTATTEMLARADAEGLYRTFQDNSVWAKTLSGLKKLINTPTGGNFGVGDLVLKYPKTPANLVARGVDYSPAGALKSIYNLVSASLGRSEFDQRKFAQDLSRAIVGSGLMSTGYLLAKTGLIKGQAEKDKEIAATEGTTNQGPFRINLTGLQRWFLNGFDPQVAKPMDGDIISSYDWLQPNAIQLSMGANIALSEKKSPDKKIDDAINTAVDSLQAGIDTLTQQPVVSGVKRFASELTSPYGGVVQATKSALTDAPASFVPSFLSQTAQFTDPNARSTYSPSPVEQTVNNIKAKIPGLRQTLEPSVGVFGEPIKYDRSGNFVLDLVNQYVNPAILRRYMDKPEADLVMDIYNRSGETQQAARIVPRSIQINGNKLTLQPKDITKYQIFVGQTTKQYFIDLVDNAKFQRLSDEEKASEMSNILSDINSAAKVILFGNKPKTMSKRAKQIVKNNKGFLTK